MWCFQAKLTNVRVSAPPPQWSSLSWAERRKGKDRRPDEPRHQSSRYNRCGTNRYRFSMGLRCSASPPPLPGSHLSLSLSLPPLTSFFLSGPILTPTTTSPPGSSSSAPCLGNSERLSVFQMERWGVCSTSVGCSLYESTLPHTYAPRLLGYRL